MGRPGKRSMFEGNLERDLASISAHLCSLRKKSESNALYNDHATLFRTAVELIFKEQAERIDRVCAAAKSGSARAALAANDLHLNKHLSTFDTPLSRVIKAGDPHLVCVLVALGADPNFRVNDRPPVILAACAGDHKVVRALLAAGAKPRDRLVRSKLPTALHAAASCNNFAMVSDLLAMGVKVDAENDRGETPLLTACARSSLGIVKALCAAGANVNVLPRDSGADRTPLMVAAERGKLRMVRELLKLGAQMNTRSRGHRRTAFLLAAGSGRDDVVRLLLDRGADPNSRDFFDRTALMIAAERGSVAIVRKLLARGAKVNPVCDLEQSALAYAAKAKSNSLSLVRILLEHGAHPDGHAKDVLPDDADLWSDRWRDMDGLYTHTPLMYAASRGDSEVVEELLQAGAKAEKAHADVEERTALLYGCISGNRRVVQLLCDAGADVGVVAMDEGGSALSAAVCGGNIDILRDLLARGAPRDVVPEYGLSALAQAAREDRMDMFRLLVEEGADVTGPSGTKALATASATGNNELLKLLLDFGAKPNALGDRDSGDEEAVPLFSAVDHGQEESVKLLLRAGACVDMFRSTYTGMYTSGTETALMSATKSRRVSCVRLLLDAHAAVDLQDHKGWTALMWALDFSEEPIAHMLVEAGASFTCRAKSGKTPLHCSVLVPSCLDLALKQQVDLDVVDEEGKTPLMWAVTGLGAWFANASTDTSVRMLIDAGADVNLVSNEGKTALSYAARLSPSRTSFFALLNAGADPFSAALEEACGAQNLDAVEALLQRGVMPTKQCMSRATTRPLASPSPEEELTCLRIIQRLRAAGGEWDGSGCLPISVHLDLASSGDPFPLGMTDHRAAIAVNAVRFATRDDTDLLLDYCHGSSMFRGKSMRLLLHENLACVRYAGARSGHNRPSVRDGARDGELCLQCAVHAHGTFTAEAVIARLVEMKALPPPLAPMSGRADLWEQITSTSVAHIPE